MFASLIKNSAPPIAQIQKGGMLEVVVREQARRLPAPRRDRE